MILLWMSSFLKFWCWCFSFWHLLSCLLVILANTNTSDLPCSTELKIMRGSSDIAKRGKNKIVLFVHHCCYQFSHSNILLLYIPCLFAGIFACQPTTINQMLVLQQLMLSSLDRKLWDTNDWKIAHASKQSSDISMLFSNLCNHLY